MSIVQGNNGNILALTITDNGNAVDLTNAVVNVSVKYKKTGITKQAAITDAINGKCQVTLNSADIQFDGVYTFQTTITFTDGREFSSEIEEFTVAKKQDFTPLSGTPTAPSIASSYNTTNVYTTDIISIPFTVTDAQGGTITATYVKDGSATTTSISTGSNTWSVGQLSEGSHTLTIHVTDNSGLTSNILTFNITSSVAPISSAPNPVTNLSVPDASSVTSNSINVTWTAPSGGSVVAHYEVSYIPSGGSWTVISSTVSASATSYTFTGLLPNTSYTLRVVALDASGNRSTDATVNATTNS